MKKKQLQIDFNPLTPEQIQYKYLSSLTGWQAYYQLTPNQRMALKEYLKYNYNWNISYTINQTNCYSGPKPFYRMLRDANSYIKNRHRFNKNYKIVI